MIIFGYIRRGIMIIYTSGKGDDYDEIAKIKKGVNIPCFILSHSKLTELDR